MTKKELETEVSALKAEIVDLRNENNRLRASYIDLVATRPPYFDHYYRPPVMEPEPDWWLAQPQWIGGTSTLSSSTIIVGDGSEGGSGE